LVEDTKALPSHAPGKKGFMKPTKLKKSLKYEPVLGDRRRGGRRREEEGIKEAYGGGGGGSSQYQPVVWSIGSMG